MCYFLAVEAMLGLVVAVAKSIPNKRAKVAEEDSTGTM